ncbi:MAG: hypothetical protein ACOCUW_05640 [Gemmatimonadota bacterium]
MLGDIFFSLGTLAGSAVARLEGDDAVPAGNPGPGTRAASGDDVAGPTPHDGPDGDGDAMVDAALGAAAAWVIGKMLRPRRVSWARVVVAGLGAAVLAEAATRALAGPGARPADDDPDRILTRLAGGVAVAAGYASLLYPRLPGPPLARGLAFGALEVATASRGGLVRLALDTPGLRFPLKELAIPPDADPGPVGGLAFGVALGLLYRPRPGGRDDADPGDADPDDA